jgi:hypothetical protein
LVKPNISKNISPVNNKTAFFNCLALIGERNILAIYSSKLQAAWIIDVDFGIG